MITVVDILLFIMAVCLIGWIFSLRKSINSLYDELANRPPEIPPISSRDLKQLQKAMIDVVQNVEDYSDTQLKKMKLQTEALYALTKRIESKLDDLHKEIEEFKAEKEELRKERDEYQQIMSQVSRHISQSLYEPEPVKSSTRIVPLTPNQSPIIHKNRDKILELYQKGWSYEKIAEELRITKGEVQLVVKLS